MNGGEHSILAVLQHLAGHTLEPTILAPESGKLWEFCRTQGWRCCPLNLSELARSPDQFTNQLKSIIAEHQIELLHANSLSAGRKLGAVASRLPCPTSTHLRDILSLSNSAISSLNEHAGMIAVSHATRDFHLAQGLDSTRSTVIYNGIDTAIFSPRPATGWLHRELGLDWKGSGQSPILAGIVGQICLRKGHLDAAAAAVMMKDRFPALHFVLVGERHSTKAESVEFDQQITRTFVEAGIPDRLHRVGWREGMETLYLELQLLIHPARQEPLGRVLLEAAACGVPVVSTHVGGTPEIFTSGESAWLVPPSNPPALAEGIERLLTEQELSQQFVQSALNVIQNRFTIPLSATNHLQFWTRLTGKEI